MTKDELMNKIYALSFALTETQLFLDTHPDCKQALEYYRRLVTDLDTAMTEYQNKYGPLMAESTGSDGWTWIEGPWPWQNNCEMNGTHRQNGR